MTQPQVIDYAPTPRFSRITAQEDAAGLSIIVPPKPYWRTLTALCIFVFVLSVWIVFTLRQAIAPHVDWVDRVCYLTRVTILGGANTISIIIILRGMHRARGQPTVVFVEGDKLIVLIPELKSPRHELIISTSLRITTKYLGIQWNLRRTGKLIIKDGEFEIELFENRKWIDIQWIAHTLDAYISDQRHAFTSTTP